jgi:hypothetical protein
VQLGAIDRAMVSMHAAKSSRHTVRECDVSNRKMINVESLRIENGFVHRRPFEYEYEYRCAECEYEKYSPARLMIDDRPRSPIWAFG